MLTEIKAGLIGFVAGTVVIAGVAVATPHKPVAAIATAASRAAAADWPTGVPTHKA